MTIGNGRLLDSPRSYAVARSLCTRRDVRPHVPSLPRWIDPASQPRRPLLIFEPVTLELQRPAVLRDHPHDVLRHAVRDFRLDLECDADAGTDEAREVRDHFLSDAAGIPPAARWIEADGAVVARRAAAGRLLPRLTRFYCGHAGCATSSERRPAIPHAAARCGHPNRLLGLHLRSGHLGLDQKAEIVDPDGDVLTRTEPTVAALLLVVALGVGECVLLPREQAEAVLDRAGQHLRALETREIRVAG